MRLRMWGLVGALALAAGACGETVGPPEAGAGRDLEFVAPVGMPGQPVRDQSGAGDVRVAAGQTASTTAGDEGGEQGVFPALIFEKLVAGSWVLDELTYSYGFRGAGTGYTMSPVVTFTSAAGTLLWSEKGLGQSEDQPVYGSMHPSKDESIRTNRWCGTTARIEVGFEVRSSLASIREKGVNRQGERVYANQQACFPGAPTLSEATNSGGGYTVQLCYYEIWYDSYGNVIDVAFYGCSTYSTTAAT